MKNANSSQMAMSWNSIVAHRYSTRLNRYVTVQYTDVFSPCPEPQTQRECVRENHLRVCGHHEATHHHLHDLTELELLFMHQATQDDGEQQLEEENV